MWVEFIEIAMEKLWPVKWEDYLRARYDYEGYVNRGDVTDWQGAEIWGAAPGKRVRSVEVVNLGGVRLRVRDDV
jgi:hypothetical protein